ncbi:MAG: hypothetical protein AAB426_04530 [Myxococcota bacterium]
MLIEKAKLSLSFAASVTCAVRWAVPLVVGFPEMAPVAPASDRPAGKLPVVIVQV